MSAVVEHHCGATVYALAGPDGPVLLDTVAVDGKDLLMPTPDGRTAEWSFEGWGHREHRCVPEGQGELL